MPLGINFITIYASELNGWEIWLQKLILSYVVRRIWSLWFLFAGINFNWFVFICIWVEYCWNMPTRVVFCIFYSTEVNIVEICLQESIWIYFRHPTWILLKYVSKNQFYCILYIWAEYCSNMIPWAILSNFVHLSWIFVEYVCGNQF